MGRSKEVGEIMSLREVAGRWHFRFQVHGHEYTGNTGYKATERNESKALLEEAKARDLVLQGRSDELRIKIIPFGEGAKTFLAWYDSQTDRPNTRRRVRSSMGVLENFFTAKLPVNALTAGHVESFKAWRRTARKETDGSEIAPVVDGTLRNDLRVLGQFLAFARRYNWLRHDPLENVDIPSGAESQRIYVVSPEEERRYFAACLAAGEVDLHDLGRLMILQGPRPDCEVLCARKEHIDLEQRTWYIPRSRTEGSKTEGGRRTLKLLPESVAIIARRIREHPESPWLFPSPVSPGKHTTALRKHHDAILQALGYGAGAGWVIYDWRHTFATRMVRAGCPLPHLAAILGHSKRNLKSIMVYVHLCDQDLHDAMERYGQQTAAPVQPAQQQQAERVQ